MKHLSLFLAILFILTMLVPVVANAAETGTIAIEKIDADGNVLQDAVVNVEYGNEWVYDEPQVIADETEAYIKNLNENVFAGYANKPQLAIMIINDLPYNMDQYKLDTFNDYGVGTAAENCGMLFIFAINDREYGLEIGDGFVKGSLLRADLETDFVTSEMKNYLRAEDYDTALKMIVQHLEKLMVDQENGVYAQKEAEKLAADQKAATNVTAKIAAIGTVTLESEGAIKEARNAYRKLTEDQKAMVDITTLEAAEETLDDLKMAQFKAGFKKFMIVVAIALPIIGVITLCVVLIKKRLRKDKIDELLRQHCRHVHIAELTDTQIKEKISKDYDMYSTSELAEEFMSILYDLYIEKQVIDLREITRSLKYGADLYISELRRVNSRAAFEHCQLTSLAIIVANVNETQRKKEELREANTRKVDDFLTANRHRVADTEIWVKLSADMHKTFDGCETEVREAGMEKHFAKQLDNLGFEKEFNRFLHSNHDKIGRDFDRDTLYREMCETNNYRNYHYGCRMDRVWMMHMLMSHQNRQKQNRLDQERRDREAAERRRREAQRRAQQQSISSRNSSFGGGFGGGRSSGGGMRGGW